MRNKLFVIVSLLMAASLVLGACAPQTPAAPQGGVTEVVKTVEVVVEGETMIVTATPEPTALPREFTSKDPNTLVEVTFGEPETFDPALSYDSASGEVLQNIYETLIWYNRDKATDFIPMLATEVPSLENGGISADGKTYTFKIRTGVKFHEGGDLTPSDVAYTYQRGILQGGTASPQWLLTEALFGIGIDDISLLVDPEGGLHDDTEALKASDPAKLKEVCERVKSQISADDAAGTFTFQLSQSWAPFLATLAGYWGSVMDKEWVIENGGWDGSCDTWQNTYAVTSENDIFTPITNGTGPYKLDHWTQGQEIVMTRFDDYWRTEPMWEGGPSGPAQIERIAIKTVNEWGTRFAMAQAGDADLFIVNREDSSQVDPQVGQRCVYDEATGETPCAIESDQPFRLDMSYPTGSRTDVFPNFNITVEGGNPFVGSGVLDGNGIPADFFSDEHVRKAFMYCFDMDAYIEEVLIGEAVKFPGIPLPGMAGYDESGPEYTFDLAKCEEEFKASTLKSPDGKSLWDVGFRMQVAYNTGNTTRQTVAEILAANISAVNELFQIEVIGLPWPTFLRAQRAETLPLFISGWNEDIHDPHNWYVPYLTGTYGRRSSLPQEYVDKYQASINAGVAETDKAKRSEVYKTLNQDVYDIGSVLLLAVATGRHYSQRWIEGWYFNPMYSQEYFYSLSKK